MTSDPFLNPSYTPPPSAPTTDPSSTSSTSDPSSSSTSSSSSTTGSTTVLGSQDVISTAEAPTTSQAFALNFDEPILDVPLNFYSQTIGQSINNFKRQDRANEAENPSLTRGYYDQIAEMCKLSRDQRDRLKNMYNNYKELVDKQNGQIATINNASAAYNPQVPGDQAAVDAFRAAVQNYNLTGDQATFDAAVAAYNSHFAAANPGIQTYHDAAVLYNQQVDQNNLKIDELNAKRAKFVPPQAPIPHQSYVIVENTVAPFPAGPYTIPVADPTVNRNIIPTIPTVADPPPPNLLTQDTTLAADQIAGLDRIIFSRQLLDSKQNNVDFIHYYLRGNTPQITDAYVQKEPEPKRGGGTASSVGLGSSMFGLSSPMLEGQVSLQAMQAALTKFGQPPFVNQGDVTYAQESFKQDVISAGVQLFTLAAKQAAVSSVLRFDNELKGLRPGGNTSDVLLASGLVNIANNFSTQESSQTINGIAGELVSGSQLFGNLSPENQAAATQIVAQLLQSSLAIFALQVLAISLNSPGLVPQTLGNAAPQFASSLKPPTSTDILNQTISAQGTQVQDLKNSLIDNLLKTDGANKRDVVSAANSSVDQVSQQGPYENLDDFYSALQDRLASEGLKADQLREAINETAIAFNNQLPLPTVTASDLDRTSAANVNGSSFLASSAGQRLLSSSGLSSDDLSTILNNAADLTSSNTLRDVRDSTIKQSLIQGNSINQSVLTGNRLAEEVVNSNVASARLTSDNINSSILKSSIEQTLQQAQISKEVAQAAAIKTSQDVADNLNQFQSDQDARAFLQKDLVDNFGIQNDVAAKTALSADFQINQTGEQLLSSIGASSLLTPSQLAESIVNVVTRELGKSIPPDKAREVADDIALKVVGREPTVNLDQDTLNSTPTSIVRIISDSTNNLQKLQDNSIGQAQANEFRDAMSPNIDVYQLTREILDPANLYIRSRFEGLQYDKKDPRDTSFRASIDVLI